MVYAQKVIDGSRGRTGSALNMPGAGKPRPYLTPNGLGLGLNFLLRLPVIGSYRFAVTRF